MKLSKVRIREFRSILDSNEFETGDITCLVGKNEAGKTAVLKALYGLNPIVPKEGDYDVTDDYPRREVEDYKQAVENKERDPATVVSVTYILDDEELDAIRGDYGPKAITDPELTMSKNYDNKRTLVLSINSAAAMSYIIANAEIPEVLKTELAKFDSASDVLNELEAAEETEEVGRLKTMFKAIEKRGFSGYAFDKHLDEREPKFLYFDEYYQMLGHENVEALQEREKTNTLKASDFPLLGLIKLARLGLDALLGVERTQDLKNKLEGAGNHLTKRVIKYWSQNKHIQMRFDVRPAQPNDPEGLQNGTNIWADIYDSRHMVTTSVGTRSRGFVWFFSFLSWYSQIQKENQNVVLLLDEPGLSLHAKAQEDLLKYFEDEIKSNHQLIYSTHSPFMVDSRHFDRVRIVQDKGIDSDGELPPEDDGTKVFTDVFQASNDSLFPLQGALGYEIYQTLFVGPNNLVVEGVSDLMYIQTISSVLQKNKREGLDSRWTITPVGGGEKVPTFVALLGNQKGLKIATLIDIQKKDIQNIENLYKRKLLDKNNVLTFADFTGTREADIEDMFGEDFYIDLVNAEFKGQFSKALSKAALNPGIPRIVKRIEEFLKANPLKAGAQLSHYRPARYFAEQINMVESKISTECMDRFEKAFKKLNRILDQ